ncbi:elongation factor Tu GTP binding domain-containing protein [Cardiosporidium cionae]|uniref:Elongation factor Tu GTP binding domain-containing protein n=1 Tax=Cardiosporidium cionae TaxID=476202 RepID=A0ABQ7JCR7_9APIC|nr:elongation factor Tu GTP binding domain-containing protein [Cardiosporidium cionae]|eukprot:KAF8821826.1 elongation factor Tu GTP binding domain-containing protein [Cardiosporidium cionae]
MSSSNVITVNVGILGHVDSGKTALVRALSTVTSTAALDKHPQSQERGITLDLGFSAFMLTLSDEEQRRHNEEVLDVGIREEFQSAAPKLDELMHQQAEGYDVTNDCKRECEETITTSLPSDIPAVLATHHREDTSADAQQRPVAFASYSPSVSPKNSSQVQVCLVDCPGHATLIRTILSGAQIIDMVILVIDITKGFQTQTSDCIIPSNFQSFEFECAECLVIAEILTTQLIVVLNKVDLIPLDQRSKKTTTYAFVSPTYVSSLSFYRLEVKRIREKLQKVFEKTTFGSAVPMVVVSATGGKSIGLPSSTSSSFHSCMPIGLNDLLTCMRKNIKILPRSEKGPLYFAFDHSFGIKGQGTIVTGTLLSGSLHVGQHVRIPSLSEISKIRSMQMFKKNIQTAKQGDRVAVSLSSIDATKLERGILIDAKEILPHLYGCIAVVQRIHFYKGKILNATKFHCTIGHTTVMCSVNFFAFCNDGQGENFNPQSQFVPSSSSSTVNGFSLSQGNLVLKNQEQWPHQFDFNCTYYHLDGLPPLDDASSSSLLTSNKDEDFCQHLPGKAQLCFAVIRFERSVQCPPNCLLICSKLDEESTTSSCRLAFFGKIVFCLEKVLAAPTKAGTTSNSILPSLDRFADLRRVQALKLKVKFGKIDRYVPNDLFALVGKSLFKDSDHLLHFIGCKIEMIYDTSKCDATTSVAVNALPKVKGDFERSSKMEGVVERAFGKTGKFIVRFSDSLPPYNTLVDPFLALRFARSSFDKQGKILQK